MISKALTIAGSDPSGGAGIQADLKTFSALRVYGMAVISALTVQNTRGVSNVMDVPSDIVAQQLDAVLTDIVPDALKTGMLANASIVEVVAGKVREYGLTKLVVDPVITSTSGARLLDTDAIEVLRQKLLPLALIVMPNLDEAQTLSGTDNTEEAARRIQKMGPQHVLIKGGHREGDAIDVLFDGKQFSYFRAQRISTQNSHGTGCVFSAAITAHLAAGKSVIEAVRLGKDFVTEAIRHGLSIGGGRGPCDPIGIL